MYCFASTTNRAGVPRHEAGRTVMAWEYGIDPNNYRIWKIRCIDNVFIIVTGATAFGVADVCGFAVNCCLCVFVCAR